MKHFLFHVAAGTWIPHIGCLLAPAAEGVSSLLVSWSLLQLGLGGTEQGSCTGVDTGKSCLPLHPWEEKHPMDELAFPSLTVSLNNRWLGQHVPAPRTMSWGRKRLRVPVTSAALCGTALARLLASISHPPVKMLSRSIDSFSIC